MSTMSKEGFCFCYVLAGINITKYTRDYQGTSIYWVLIHTPQIEYFHVLDEKKERIEYFNVPDRKEQRIEYFHILDKDY